MLTFKGIIVTEPGVASFLILSDWTLMRLSRRWKTYTGKTVSIKGNIKALENDKVCFDVVEIDEIPVILK